MTVRPPRTPLIGPLFAWELVRLARRGQDMRARCILAFTLLLTLTGFVILWFPGVKLADLFFATQQTLSSKESARFAEQFSLALLEAQMAVMVLLTPAYAAGAVSEEKDRRTYGFLLASLLSSREIVLGKLLARVVFLLGVMFAGLPVLAITGLAGGIDATFLITGYALTGTTVVLIAAASTTAAVYATTYRGALFRAYGLTAIYVLFGCGLHPYLSPFAVLVLPYLPGPFGIGSDSYILPVMLYMGAQLTVATGAVWLGVRAARSKIRRRPPPRDLDRGEKPVPLLVADDVPAEDVPKARPLATKRPKPRPRPEEPRQDYQPDAVRYRPKVFGDDPYWWKEKYTLGTKRTGDEESIRSVTKLVGGFVALTLGGLTAISLLAAVASPQRGDDSAARILILAGTGGMFAHLLVVGGSACTAVLRERQRFTLESLLVIPDDRYRMLWPKLRACLTRGWWWGLAGTAAVVLGLLASRVPYAALPAAAFGPAVTAFTAGLGLYLSIHSHTTARAVMILLSAIGGFLLVPITGWWLFDERDPAWQAAAWVTVGTLLAGGLGFAFWKKAVRSFERYGRD